MALITDLDITPARFGWRLQIIASFLWTLNFSTLLQVNYKNELHWKKTPIYKTMNYMYLGMKLSI